MRRFILHMATIGAAAGADDFLIGTEMVQMTRIRSGPTQYPSVDRLKILAADARAILGPSTRISYASDWSEYHSHRPDDGSGDVLFHLDPLWADPNIDFIGIDNYLPISDWRDGTDHLDYYVGHRSIYDLNYLKSQIEGGEGYDWFYADMQARENQDRTPIVDGAYGKHWVFRQKDIRSWWSNLHVNRIGGVEVSGTTEWVPQSKPVVFTELGCSAADKGTNQPNVFLDPKSSESFLPYFSSGRRDELIQRAYLEAWHGYWEGDNNPISSIYGGPMLDMESAAVWTWDARPYPAFPNRDDYWEDSINWQFGHWINGRFRKEVESLGWMGTYAYTDASRPLTVLGVEYLPEAVTCGSVRSSGGAERDRFEVRLPRDADFAQVFQTLPPGQPVSLTVRQGYLGTAAAEYLVAWAGRVLSARRIGNEMAFTCEPIASSLKRPALRRTYQPGCPHALYGPDCGAAQVRLPVTVTEISGTTLGFPANWSGAAPPEKFLGGIVEWSQAEGRRDFRRILQASAEGVVLSGGFSGMAPGAEVQVSLGCNRTVDDCRNLHNNIHNFGGFPTIPTKNPVASGTTVFY